MTIDCWASTRLGDLVEIKHGWPFKSEYFNDTLTGKPLVISVGNFRYTGGFRFAETTVKEYRSSYPKEYELTAGDILLIMTCQTAGGEILGVPARVPNDGRIYLHNQRLGKVVIRNQDRIDADYLYFLFLWSEFNRELVNSASGTKILHTAPSRITAFCFQLPPLAEQRTIAHILRTLDDKIELNQRMNETLEAMARALFKSWFVDFDPVRAKVEGRWQRGQSLPGLPAHLYDIFPDRLVDSELGEIPEGWEVKTVGDLAELDKGLSYKGEGLSGEGGLPMINLGCFLGAGQFRPENIKRYRGEYRDHHLIHAGDLVIANTDMTQNRVILGSPVLVPKVNGEQLYLFTHHTFAARFKPGAECWKQYVYFSLLQPEFREIAEGYATGTTVLALPRDGVLKYPIVLPREEVRGIFEKHAENLIARTDAAHRESRILTRLLDTLLPKLISGDLRIPHADRLVKEVA
jgi:type I restriction enzyme S subunit